MKGYYDGGNYYGYLPSTGKYMRFPNDSEYEEYFRTFEEA